MCDALVILIRQRVKEAIFNSDGSVMVQWDEWKRLCGCCSSVQVRTGCKMPSIRQNPCFNNSRVCHFDIALSYNSLSLNRAWMHKLYFLLQHLFMICFHVAKSIISDVSAEWSTVVRGFCLFYAQSFSLYTDTYLDLVFFNISRQCLS